MLAGRAGSEASIPLEIRYSARHQLVVIEASGVIDAALVTDELLPLIEKPELALVPLALFDLTEVEATSAPSQLIRAAARKAMREVDPNLVEAKAKFAIVATRDELFGLGRMYGLLRGDRVEINVFRSLADAEDWLGLPADYRQDLEPVAR